VIRSFALFPRIASSIAVLLLALGAGSVYAQEDTVRVAPIVVTPTRVEQSAFDLPVSIDAIEKDVIQTAQPQVNTSEVLVRAPGVVANDRTNLASDLQISIRGFGARAPFGVRGIRIIADGIPLTMPDGQSQSGNIDLATAKQIEVLRGPFSALYGNSSGGVINVFTEDGPEQHTVTGSAWLGSFNSSKIGLKVGGQQGRVNYVANVARYDTDGYRDHAEATRNNFNSKLRVDVSDDTTLTLIANALKQESQNPGSLTRAQFDADPTQSGTNPALNTREILDNTQLGAVLSHKLNAEDTIRLAGYAGTRNVEGYQNFSLPQAAPTRGVLGLDREFRGLDLRWTRQADMSGKPLNFTIGVNYDYMTEQRRSWGNVNGEKGALGRDEDNSVFNFDQFAQAELAVTDRWNISGGVRHTSVRFKSEDHFVTTVPLNPDDSGSLKFSKTTPVIGTLFKVTPTLNVYANAGKGFETPTNVELAYASSNSSVTGMNFSLKPSSSNNYEVGVKAYVGANTRVNAAVFKIDTKDEVALFTFAGGRSVYHNVDSTSREGFELMVDSAFGGGFKGLLVYSYIDATYDNSFAACVNVCATGPNTTVPAGNKIPGIPENMAFGELAWANDRGLSTAMEVRWMDKVFVNDVNTESADAFTVVNWRLALEQKSGGWRFTEFGRVNNLLDKKYVGSVVLNDSGGAFYEPAPDRNYILGVSASYQF
jgi:iron complex outermembrane recepter protein